MVNKPTPNIALKVAIIQSEKKQHDVARAARIPETRFSHIVRGRAEPSKKERARIATALGKPQEDLFPMEAISA